MKKKALFLTVFGLAVLMLSCACSKQITPENYEQSSKPTSPIYIFMNSRFLGSCFGGEWNSLSNPEDTSDVSTFLLKDVVAGKYFCYQNGKKMFDATRLRLSPACLSNVVDIELLQQYGTSDFTKDGNQYYIFPSPLVLDEQFDDTFLPASNISVYFGNDEGFPEVNTADSQDVSHKRLALNADFDPFHREIKSIEPTQAAIDGLCRLFAESDMENTYPVFYESYSGDFDDDGKEESVFFANSTRGENGGIAIKAREGKTEKLGTYTTIMYQDDNGSFETIFKDFRPYQGNFTATSNNEMELPFMEQEMHFQYISADIIADVNNDGLFEIICNVVGQGNSGCFLFAQDAQGTYTIVLRAYDS